jgi:hypothetical protein
MTIVRCHEILDRASGGILETVPTDEAGGQLVASGIGSEG